MGRCWWCEGDPVYEKYHDRVWGRQETDESKLFAMLSLELFQSGLAWITILRKEEAFRAAFVHWDIAAIAQFEEADILRLLDDAGIVRHRKKIEAVINNARLYPQLQEHYGSLHTFLHGFAPVAPTPTGGFTRANLPLLLDEAQLMSKTLKKMGYKFTGPMVCMSLMQAVGVVNHHVQGCERAPQSGPRNRVK